jgi:hypothetical protein
VLELPDDLPVHRTSRTYYTAEGVAFEVTVMIQGGHLYGLQYRQPTRESSQAPDGADPFARSLTHAQFRRAAPNLARTVPRSQLKPSGWDRAWRGFAEFAPAGTCRVIAAGKTRQGHPACSGRRPRVEYRCGLRLVSSYVMADVHVPAG